MKIDITIKNLVLGLSLFVFLTLYVPEKTEAEIELIDRVIAVVDTGIILESELNSRVGDIIGRLRSEGTELPPKDLLEEQVLERLIIEGHHPSCTSPQRGHHSLSSCSHQVLHLCIQSRICCQKNQ